MSETQRRYLSKNGLRDLMRSVDDPKTIDLKNLCVLAPMPVQVKAVGSENSRLIEFIVSTGRVDRENDTIEPSGWDLTDYKSNPVVLWVHDHWSPPIANARTIYLDGDALKSMCEFTPEDINPFGYQVYKLYQGGYMHACSAGFQPIEYAYDEMRKYGINFKKQSLLEYSCVPVPANPDALAVARSKGLKTDLLKAWAERAMDEHPTTDDARRQLEVLRNLSTPDGRALILEIGGMKMAEPAAKTDPPAPPPTDKTAPTDAVVKKVERWTCGEGHEHTTEQEAKDCGNIAAIIASSVTSVKALTDLLVGEQAKAVEKAGRVLSAANEERLRSALSDMTTCMTRIGEVLAQLPAEEDDEEDDKDATGVLMVTAAPEDRQDKDTDGEGSITFDFPDGVDPVAVLTAAVKATVQEEINRLTGRVD